LPEVQNPNLQTQGSGGGGTGGDFRSTMAFMLLVFAAILGYQYFFAKPKPEEKPSQPAQSQSVSSPAPAAPEPRRPAATTARPVAATPTISASQESELTAENELYRIVLTNRGGRIKHWFLKKYFDSTGKPLDLVQPEAAAHFGLPLSLFTYEPALTTQLNDALYQPAVTGAQPSAAGLVVAPATITYHYAANGLDVVKTVQFNSSYAVNVETEVERNGEPVRALIEWPAGLGDMEEFAQSSMIHGQTPTPSYFGWSIDGRESSQAASKVSGNNTLDEPYQYAAVMDVYFAAAFLPSDPDHTTVVTLHNAINLPNPSDPNGKKTPHDVLGIAVGDTSGNTKLRLFAGPKATAVLSSIHTMGADGKPDGPTLESLIEFGWMAFIAKPLYLILRWMVQHGIGSWGWAIIISTVVFNLALLPTRIAAMKSSLKTMRIQPKVDAIKNRYKHLKMNDPKRGDMNTEMMALYKAENVNMYGSCLPMLVPLILLWPYFRVLQYAVELRQSHWMWLPDLSQPDPTYVLPILIIITMFLTQYITPSPGMDPAQRRMMAFIMPIFFGFMLLHYASGLALYWCTGNVIMLAMQVGINRSHWGKEMHEIAARRALKSKR
jgi:YidC/Oxa1 family membrane protein insertase